MIFKPKIWTIFLWGGFLINGGGWLLLAVTPAKGRPHKGTAAEGRETEEDCAGRHPGHGQGSSSWSVPGFCGNEGGGNPSPPPLAHTTTCESSLWGFFLKNRRGVVCFLKLQLPGKNRCATVLAALRGKSQPPSGKKLLPAHDELVGALG